MDFDSMSDSIEVASSVSEISDSELPKLVEQTLLTDNKIQDHSNALSKRKSYGEAEN